MLIGVLDAPPDVVAVVVAVVAVVASPVVVVAVPVVAVGLLVSIVAEEEAVSLSVDEVVIGSSGSMKLAPPPTDCDSLQYR